LEKIKEYFLKIFAVKEECYSQHWVITLSNPHFWSKSSVSLNCCQENTSLWESKVHGWLVFC